MLFEFQFVLVLLLLAALIAIQFYFAKSMILKIVAITFFLLTFSSLFFTTESYKGWYSSEGRIYGYLLSAQVYEPTDIDPGAIYLWVVNKDVEKTWVEQLLTYIPEKKFSPRSYFLPYTEDDAAATSDAKQRIKDGMIVTVDIESQNSLNIGKPVDDGEEAPSSAGVGERSGSQYRNPYTFLAPSDLWKKER